MKRLFLLITFVLLNVAYITTNSLSFAATINVPGDYATITAAIISANTNDIIEVEEGEYLENILITKRITLRSIDTDRNPDTNAVISSASSFKPVITITANAIVDGFIIRDGDVPQLIKGGGISCQNSDPMIFNNTIEENSSYEGGGIACYNSGAIIINNIITNNNPSDPNLPSFGGGIYCYNSNPIIKGNTITNNEAGHGAGIYLKESYPMIKNNRITNNVAREIGPPHLGYGYGGGIYCIDSPQINHNIVSIVNNIIANNTCDVYGAGIFTTESTLNIINNTITLNEADHGGGITFFHDRTSTLINSIVWENFGEHPHFAQIYKYYIPDQENPQTKVVYSNIGPGPLNPDDTVYSGQGNMLEDPRFLDADAGDFRLGSRSPCVDAAEGDIAPRFDIDNNPRHDDIGVANTGVGTPNYVDLGAYEKQDNSSAGVREDSHAEPIPSSFKIEQNYPNPFNPMTTIEYAVPKTGHVELRIYNSTGQLVRSLVNEDRRPGNYSVTWDGKSDVGQGVASGTYFYQLTVGDFTSAKKAIFLK